MPLFDHHMIVDWSANNAPKLGADSIWLCDQRGPASNATTRLAAMDTISAAIREVIAQGKRLFIGFDFGFGYPRGFAEALTGVAGWKSVWARIADDVSDDATNANNRFHVGSDYNKALGGNAVSGPFWGHPYQHKGRYSHLGATKPDYRAFPEKRHVEGLIGGAQPVWKLAYTGSVGGQTLLGVRWLEQLRRVFGKALAVWPFDTNFANHLDAPVTVAEVYPSLFPVQVHAGEVKDAAQVRAVSQGFAALDRAGSLGDLLARPACLNDAQADDVVREEGWIVGAGHSVDGSVFA
ncbi:MAG: cobalamin biosynthesis protein CbiG [Pseudomonadota bacterium]